MIKVFIPQVKGKFGKRDLAKGFWRNDTGITSYDYLKVYNYTQKLADNYFKNLFYNYLDTIKAGYNQEALFYVNEAGQGIVYYSRDNQEVLPNRIYTEVSRAGLKTEIKEALRVYGGVTIYREGKRYFKEVYHNREA